MQRQFVGFAATNGTAFAVTDASSIQGPKSQRWGWGETQGFLCECSDSSCTSPIRLTHSEYEDIRAEPVRFAIVVDHENPELDRVRTENARFATVDKIYGPGAQIARATDPRR